MPWPGNWMDQMSFQSEVNSQVKVVVADESSWSIDVAVEAQECLPIGVAVILGLGACYGGLFC